MRIREIKCKSILTKSKLPECAYCINPYVGCVHGCIYCYARFMKRFTGHKEEWGDFLDVRINSPEVLRKQLSSRRVKRGTVLLGSVTDVYQPLERKYNIVRSILEILLEYDFPISVLTKSDLVLRDIDLFKQFKECEVGLTMTTLDEQDSKNFEPCSSSPQKRLKALETLRNEGVKTYAFIGPVLPGITDLNLIFSELRNKVDFVMVETLNIKCGNWEHILELVKEKYPQLLPIYHRLDKEYWDKVESMTKELSKKNKIPLKGFYKH